MQILIVYVCLILAIRTLSPPSISLKAIELWMIACIIFVFMAMLEYFCLLRMVNKIDRLNNKEKEKRLVRGDLTITII